MSKTWIETERLLLLLALALAGLSCLAACVPSFQPSTATSAEATASPEPSELPTATPATARPRPGRIQAVEGRFGDHVAYVPMDLGAGPPIVVLAHGTPAEDETALDTARTYVEYYRAWADQMGAILLAPAFDQPNFGSKDPDMTGGGYRGLFGREVGADVWVLNLVDTYRAWFGGDGRFFLYGHSAGGQHAARFLVTHPQRLRGVVITAALTYPHPNLDVSWPYGLAPLDANLKWTDPVAETVVQVEPDVNVWLEGLAVPTTVIVGLNDLERQLDWPGQEGKNNRVVIARFWVGEMEAFGAEHGFESQIDLSLVPGRGHSAHGLLEYSQQAMTEVLDR